jgi:hypothetical protein
MWDTNKSDAVLPLGIFFKQFVLLLFQVEDSVQRVSVIQGMLLDSLEQFNGIS